MLLKSWRSVILLLMLVLAACGTADTTDRALSDTGVQASATPDSAYPVLSTATSAPTATNIPPTNISTPTLSPTSVATEVAQADITVLASNEAPVTLDPITVITATTVALHEGSYPMYLAGWSPDEHMILYTTSAESNGIDRVDLYTVDVHDGTQYLLANDAIGAISSSWGRDNDYLPPQWSATCCEIFYATAASSTTQQIMQTDWQGTQHTPLATTAQGPFFIAPQQDVVAATIEGLDFGRSTTTSTIDAWREEIPRTSYTSNGHTQYVYISSDRTVLQLGSIEPPFKAQTLTVDLLLPQSRIAGLIQSDDPYFPDGLYFDTESLSWSQDGRYLAFALHYGHTYELWLYDSRAEEVQSLKLVTSPLAGITLRLAPDASKLAYTVVNVTRDPPFGELYIYRIADQQEVYVDSRVASEPVWSPTGTYLSTQREGVNILVVYKIEE